MCIYSPSSWSSLIGDIVDDEEGPSSVSLCVCVCVCVCVELKARENMGGYGLK